MHKICHQITSSCEEWGETGGKMERNEDGIKWDALNLNDFFCINHPSKPN